MMQWRCFITLFILIVFIGKCSSLLSYVNVVIQVSVSALRGVLPPNMTIDSFKVCYSEMCHFIL